MRNEELGIRNAARPPAAFMGGGVGIPNSYFLIPNSERRVTHG
jgi:hypothetical protein